MRPVLLAALLAASPAFAAGPKVSLELQRADVHSVLRLFAELGHLNLVTDDAVSGTVTLSLRNVRWDEAFQVVLNARGLGLEKLGSIVRVAPLAQLAAEAQQRAHLEEARFDARPLVTHLIPVSYASASELATQVKPLLSRRGSVSVDTRTNTLIVRDVE